MRMPVSTIPQASASASSSKTKPVSCRLSPAEMEAIDLRRADELCARLEARLKARLKPAAE